MPRSPFTRPLRRRFPQRGPGPGMVPDAPPVAPVSPAQRPAAPGPVSPGPAAPLPVKRPSVKLRFIRRIPGLGKLPKTGLAKGGKKG